MNVTKTRLKGVIIIEPRVFGDERGFFKETFQAERYQEIGIDFPFVQDNFSRSQKGVLRGLHFQKRGHREARQLLAWCGLGCRCRHRLKVTDFWYACRCRAQ